MQHYLIKIQYDGQSFDGWQRLRDNPNTIQQTIEDALSHITGEHILINGSGRTDSGVHATAQYADFRCDMKLNRDMLTSSSTTSNSTSLCTSDDMTYSAFLKKCANCLPETIRIISITEVQESFHTRKNCTEKTYTYCISCNSKPDVFSARYVYNPVTPPLSIADQHRYDGAIIYDDNKMNIAVKHLLGTHDFSAFTSDKTPEKSHIRCISSIKISYIQTPSNKRIMVLSFTGNGFLYNMVRILAGTLVSCGLGLLEPERIPDIIASKKRSANPAATLPGNALFLTDVQFENILL